MRTPLALILPLCAAGIFTGAATADDFLAAISAWFAGVAVGAAALLRERQL